MRTSAEIFQSMTRRLDFIRARLFKAYHAGSKSEKEKLDKILQLDDDLRASLREFYGPKIAWDIESEKEEL